MSEAKPVILTCAQPTGQLTIGNYLGAVKNWATMLDDYECYFGVVDLHAITVKYSPAELRKNTLSCVAQYIACGLDPERSKILCSPTSSVTLSWLGCLVASRRLEIYNAAQFMKAPKSAFNAGEGNELKFTHDGARAGASVNSGLLMYPVLMAADILLYNADAVPVGNDQRQHLELCRDLAQRFNHTYSDTFTIPKPFIPKQGARIMARPKTQDVEERREPKLNSLHSRRAICIEEKDYECGDGLKRNRGDEDKPGVSNLLQIYSTMSDTVSISKPHRRARATNFKGSRRCRNFSVRTYAGEIQRLDW